MHRMARVGYHKTNTITTELKRILSNAGARYSVFVYPVLRTKSVTKKEMNKCMAEIYDPGGIRTRAARLISQNHNH